MSLGRLPNSQCSFPLGKCILMSLSLQIILLPFIRAPHPLSTIHYGPSTITVLFPCHHRCHCYCYRQSASASRKWPKWILFECKRSGTASAETSHGSCSAIQSKDARKIARVNETDIVWRRNSSLICKALANSFVLDSKRLSHFTFIGIL